MLPLFVIIAGGASRNFAPLSNKALFPFAGRPIVCHVLETARNAGFTDILIVTSAENHSFLSDLKMEGLSILTIKQEKPLGMADALLSAEKEIGDRPVVVSNAADLFEDQLFRLVLQKTGSAYAAIPGIEVSENFPGGYIKLEGEKPVAVIEKPAPGDEPSNLVILTAHYFSKPGDFMHLLKKTQSQNDDVYEQALTRLLQEHDVECVRYSGKWKKLKYGFHVLDVMEMILGGKIETHTAASANVSVHAHVSGNVFIDEGAQIMDTAVIIGPAYIGKNARIGQHTLIRQSMIEEGSVIGFGSEINRSYIGPGCMLHHNGINDSVLESKVNPSFGTVTANLRLDSKPVDLKLPDRKIPSGRTKLGAILARGVYSGVNCSFMPGITAGAESRIYPGTVVYKPVEAGAIFK